MIRYNFHTHAHFCDGKGTMEEFVQAALKAGIQYLGFTSHAPVPFETDWTMPEEKFQEYRENFITLKEKYGKKIHLFLGLEADYIPGLLSPDRVKIERNLDYVIGSVHFLGRLEDGFRWTVDGPFEEFSAGLEYTFGNNIRLLAEEFYSRVAAMASVRPDIIGHFDLVKIHNRGERYFSENEDWYRKAVEKALAAVAQSGSVLEINTGGILRNKIDDFYPSEWIIRECVKRGIPLMVNSDAHAPDQVAGGIEAALDFLKNKGVDKTRCLTEKGWITV